MEVERKWRGEIKKETSYILPDSLTNSQLWKIICCQRAKTKERPGRGYDKAVGLKNQSKWLVHDPITQQEKREGGAIMAITLHSDLIDNWDNKGMLDGSGLW